MTLDRGGPVLTEVAFVHLCDYAFLADGDKPCIIGIFDAIHAARFPVTHPIMALAIGLRGRAHDVVPLHIEIGHPNGAVMATMTSTVTTGTDGTAFMHITIVNAEFPESGRYTITISSASRTLAIHAVPVQKTRQTLDASRTEALRS